MSKRIPCPRCGNPMAYSSIQCADCYGRNRRTSGTQCLKCPNTKKPGEAYCNACHRQKCRDQRDNHRGKPRPHTNRIEAVQAIQSALSDTPQTSVEITRKLGLEPGDFIYGHYTVAQLLLEIRGMGLVGAIRSPETQRWSYTLAPDSALASTLKLRPFKGKDVPVVTQDLEPGTPTPQEAEQLVIESLSAVTGMNSRDVARALRAKPGAPIDGKRPVSRILHDLLERHLIHGVKEPGKDYLFCRKPPEVPAPEVLPETPAPGVQCVDRPTEVPNASPPATAPLNRAREISALYLRIEKGEKVCAESAEAIEQAKQGVALAEKTYQRNLGHLAELTAELGRMMQGLPVTPQPVINGAYLYEWCKAIATNLKAILGSSPGRSPYETVPADFKARLRRIDPLLAKLKVTELDAEAATRVGLPLIMDMERHISETCKQQNLTYAYTAFYHDHTRQGATP